MTNFGPNGHARPMKKGETEKNKKLNFKIQKNIKLF